MSGAAFRLTLLAETQTEWGTATDAVCKMNAFIQQNVAALFDRKRRGDVLLCDTRYEENRGDRRKLQHWVALLAHVRRLLSGRGTADDAPLASLV